MNTESQPSLPAPTTPDNPQLQVLPPPKPRKTRRNGRIAQLPKAQRDMVSRMLQDAIPYDRILGFLDEFGIHATVRNISNWKTRGGYEEWRLEQKQIADLRLQQDLLVDHLRDDPNELSEVGLQLAATRYLQLLLRPDVQEKIQADPDKLLPVVNMLCKLSREILRLQKFRDARRTPGNPGYCQEKGKAEEFVEYDIHRQVHGAPVPSDPDADFNPRVNRPRTWLEP